MKSFSKLISEAIKNTLKGQDLLDFNNKLKKNLPIIIQQLLQLTASYDIVDGDTLDSIKNLNSSDLTKLSNKLSIPENDLIKIQQLLKDAGDKIKMLPQYMSDGVYNAVFKKQIPLDDVMIDLKTAKGKNQVAKQYMPLVYKIVNSNVGRSRLSKTDLISVALEALNDAIENWSPEPNKNGKVISFKAFTSYRIQQAILNEIDNNSFTVSGGNYYMNKKYGTKSLNAISIDGMRGSYDDEWDQDKLGFLGIEDPGDKESQSEWKEFFKLLEKTFPERTCNVFYRYYGLNGYKKEKSKDIAKSIGMSEGAIRNTFIKKILKWINDNKQVRGILGDIQDMYTESLMCNVYAYSNRESIVEYFLKDDIYILLEEMNPWRNKTNFDNMYNNAKKYFTKEEIKKIDHILNGNFLTIDDNLKKESELIKKFVTLMYPKLTVNTLSDVSLLDKMTELQEIYKKK